MISRVILWISTGLIFYPFAGYPLLLWFLQFVFPRKVRKKNIEPLVSILVAAYNEAPIIATKIQNSLTLDYPPDRLEIVVAADGSTDETVEIVRTLVQKEGLNRVRLLNYPEN